MDPLFDTKILFWHFFFCKIKNSGQTDEVWGTKNDEEEENGWKETQWDHQREWVKAPRRRRGESYERERGEAKGDKTGCQLNKTDDGFWQYQWANRFKGQKKEGEKVYFLFAYGERSVCIYWCSIICSAFFSFLNNWKHFHAYLMIVSRREKHEKHMKNS